MQMTLEATLKETIGALLIGTCKLALRNSITDLLGFHIRAFRRVVHLVRTSVVRSMVNGSESIHLSAKVRTIIVLLKENDLDV